MLEGKPLKVITAFVLPIIFGAILQHMYSMVDTSVVGKVLGDNALAAVGATSLTFSIIITLTNGFMTGFSIIAGQKVGASDYDGLKRVYVNGLLLVFFISVLSAVLLSVFTDNLMDFMKVPENLRTDASGYIRIIYIGLPTTMLYTFFCEILRAMGNSKKPFFYLVISSVINIVLDLYFICVLKTGVAGAALATVIAQAVSAILCFININRSDSYFKIKKEDIRLDKHILAECSRIGIPGCLVNAVICCGILVFQIFTNKFGVEYIAASSAAAKIYGIYTIPVYSFASGLAVYAAQNFGGKKYDRIKYGVRTIFVLMFSYSAVMLIVSLLTTPFVVKYVISDTPLVVKWASIIVNVNLAGQYSLVFLILIKYTLNSLGKPFMSTMQGFVDMALRMGVVYFGVRYFGFWGIVLSDVITWFIGSLAFIFMIIPEIRNLKKTYGFNLI